MKLSIAFAVALFAPAYGVVESTDVRPDMVVTFPRGACDCIAQENTSITWPSGTCTKPGSNPPVTWECYTFTSPPLYDPPTEPNGRCYNPPNCTQTARACEYRGFKVTITQNPCVTDCCAGGAGKVKLNGVLQGAIAPGGVVGPINIHPGTRQCTQSDSSEVLVTCDSTGATVFGVRANFLCGACVGGVQ